MAVKTAKKANAALYEADLAAWATETAEHIRARQWEEIDPESVAEEIEALARKDRKELKNHLVILISHLLKWRFQPSHRSSSWTRTIDEQRRQIEFLLEDSPSLQSKISAALDSVHNRARRETLRETHMSEEAIPADFRFTLAQLLNEEFFPDR